MEGLLLCSSGCRIGKSFRKIRNSFLDLLLQSARWMYAKFSFSQMCLLIHVWRMWVSSMLGWITECFPGRMSLTNRVLRPLSGQRSESSTVKTNEGKQSWSQQQQINIFFPLLKGSEKKKKNILLFSLVKHHSSYFSQPTHLSLPWFFLKVCGKPALGHSLLMTSQNNKLPI